MSCWRRFAAMLLAVSLAGCGKPMPADNALTKLDSALIDAAQRDGQSGDAPDAPAGLQSPAPPPAVGRHCHSGGRNGDCTPAELVKAPNCGNAFTTGLRWATRLPAGLELYPGAKVIEAAGSDQGDCHIRIVSYVSDARPDELAEWYRAAASAAGYVPALSRRGREQTVSGLRSPAGDAFYLTIAADGDVGSTVDLIANHGG